MISLFISFVRPKKHRSFLLLAQKKRTKEKGSLKSFLGVIFSRLPTQYNSLSALRRIVFTFLIQYYFFFNLELR